MAVKAPAHVHANNRFGNHHFTHVAMAGLSNHAGTEVGLMAEKNKVGHIVHRKPGDGFVPLPIIKNEIYIGTIRVDGLMAANASSHGGNTGDVRSKCIGVAE